MNLAYENDQLVGVTDFEYPADEQPEPSRDDAAESLQTFLSTFTGLKLKPAGYRILILAHLNGKSGFETDIALAKHMGISASRLSHLLSEFAPTFPSLSRLKRRQRERRKRNVANTGKIYD